MTRQEIFDTVAAHLIAQGHRAWDPDVNNCAYRAPNGDKRAIGRLIPDDLYVEEMEGNSVDEFYYRDTDTDAVDAFLATLERLGVDEADELTHDLLVDLQGAHDQADNWPDIGGALSVVADRHGLEVSF